MKKLSRVLAIILTTGISISAFASRTIPKNPKAKHVLVNPTNSTVSVAITSSEDSMGLKVSALNETSIPVTISIYDKDGVIVFTEEISSEQINRSYNLASLPKSTYTVFVSSDNFSTFKEITIQ